jgi:hypothetical protein
MCYCDAGGQTYTALACMLLAILFAASFSGEAVAFAPSGRRLLGKPIT